MAKCRVPFVRTNADANGRQTDASIGSSSLLSVESLSQYRRPLASVCGASIGLQPEVKEAAAPASPARHISEEEKSFVSSDQEISENDGSEDDLAHGHQSDLNAADATGRHGTPDGRQ